MQQVQGQDNDLDIGAPRLTPAEEQDSGQWGEALHQQSTATGGSAEIESKFTSWLVSTWEEGTLDQEQDQTEGGGQVQGEGA